MTDSMITFLVVVAMVFSTIFLLISVISGVWIWRGVVFLWKEWKRERSEVRG